jgi:hypothetical protein
LKDIIAAVVGPSVDISVFRTLGHLRQPERQAMFIGLKSRRSGQVDLIVNNQAIRYKTY